MKTLFDHASFISADTPKTLGSLANLATDSGFLAWLRLVGTVYFQKHKSAFPNHSSPRSLFMSLQLPNITTTEHQGVKLSRLVAIVINKCTAVTNFQNFSGFRRHYWRLSCSSVYSYCSRLVSLVCGVCTQSDQLQATAPPGVDTAYLWTCFNEYIAQEICSVVHFYC